MRFLDPHTSLMPRSTGTILLICIFESIIVASGRITGFHYRNPCTFYVVPAADEGGGLPAPAVRSFRAAFDVKLEEGGQQLEALKGRHRGADDALGRELDRVSGELSGAAESAALKQDLKRRNEARLAQLQPQARRRPSCDIL